MECDKKTLVLVDKRHLQAHVPPWLFVVLLLAVTILPFVFLTAAISPEASWGSAVGKSLESLRTIQWSQLNWSKMLSSLAMIGFAFVQIIYLNWAKKNERLTLSPDGIRYTSPLPVSLKRLQPDWFLPWNGISAIELDALNDRLINATLVRMTLTSSTEQRRIFPAVWVDPTTYSRPASRLSFPLRQWLCNATKSSGRSQHPKSCGTYPETRPTSPLHRISTGRQTIPVWKRIRMAESRLVSSFC